MAQPLSQEISGAYQQQLEIFA